MLVLLVELIACMSEAHSTYFPIFRDLTGGVLFSFPDSEHAIFLFNIFLNKKVILIKKKIIAVQSI